MIIPNHYLSIFKTVKYIIQKPVIPDHTGGTLMMDLLH